MIYNSSLFQSNDFKVAKGVHHIGRPGRLPCYTGRGTTLGVLLFMAVLNVMFFSKKFKAESTLRPLCFNNQILFPTGIDFKPKGCSCFTKMYILQLCNENVMTLIFCIEQSFEIRKLSHLEYLEL